MARRPTEPFDPDLSPTFHFALLENALRRGDLESARRRQARLAALGYHVELGELSPQAIRPVAAEATV